MDSNVLVAFISFCGTLVGSGLGVMASSKLTTFRLEQLEKKVNEHNDVIKRTFLIEKEIEIIQKSLDEVHEWEEKHE